MQNIIISPHDDDRECLIADDGGPAFDYAEWPADVADEARRIAKSIAQEQRRVVAQVIRFGLDLLALKERLEHGQFTKWLRVYFERDPRIAQHWMNVANKFGDKTETVSDLKVSSLYLLAAPSTPDATRDDILARIEGGETLQPKDIKQIVSMAKANQSSGSSLQGDSEAKRAQGVDWDEAHGASTTEPTDRGGQIVVLAEWLNERLGGEADAFLDLLEGAEGEAGGNIVGALRAVFGQTHRR